MGLANGVTLSGKQILLEENNFILAFKPQCVPSQRAHHISTTVLL